MHAKLKDAIRLFNRREYFTCHQILEEMWHAAPDEEKAFYEGLVRLATGLHLRFNRRAPQGAIHLLTQGLMCLEEYRPTHQGVDVTRLYHDIEAHLNELKASPSPRAGFFARWRVPQIREVE